MRFLDCYSRYSTARQTQPPCSWGMARFFRAEGERGRRD